VGARFRLHGRDPADGLDCVGLAAWGFEMEAPRGYALRTGDAGHVARLIAAAGLVPAADERAGDLLLMASGPGQLHLGIATELGFIHADAGLRRVVERPGVPPWPVVGRWRREN
jgi:lipoprotein Spr